MSTVLYEEAGPRGRRNILIGSVAGFIVLLGLVAFVIFQLGRHGQLEPQLWRILLRPDLLELLFRGLLATLKAACVAMVLALIGSIFFAIGRMSERVWLRWPVSVLIEILRGVPLLLLIFCFYLGAPVLGFEVSTFWALVLGLTFYNSVVMGEIVRAGILSLPKGQAEAAASIGLTRGQTLAYVLLPQAIWRMLPAITSQLVIVLKETSLGFIVGYEEMLRNGRTAVEYLGGQYSIPVYTAMAAVYIAGNVLISLLAAWLERRSRGASARPRTTMPDV